MYVYSEKMVYGEPLVTESDPVLEYCPYTAGMRDIMYIKLIPTTDLLDCYINGVMLMFDMDSIM